MAERSAGEVNQLKVMIGKAKSFVIFWGRRAYTCTRENPTVILTLVFLIFLICVVITMFTSLFRALLSTPGVVVLYLTLFVLLVRFLVRALVFPGSTLLWQKKIENSYRTDLSKAYCDAIVQLEQLILVLSGRVAWRKWTLQQAAFGVNVLQQLQRNFQIQRQDPRCAVFSQKKLGLEKKVHAVLNILGHENVRIEKRDGSTVGFLRWLRESAGSNKADTCVEQKLRLTEELPGVAELRKVAALMRQLEEPEETYWAGAKRFFAPATIGSLDQVRAELLQRRPGARQFWVPVSAGAELDAVIIRHGSHRPKAEQNGPNHASGSLASSADPETAVCYNLHGDNLAQAFAHVPAAVIMCNPNAGYYESTAFQGDWVDFYLSLNCSVVLFNYRGFARSTGAVHPENVRADGRAVYQFLRRHGIAKIGVHGRSIGSVCACEIAAKEDVAFCVVDRGFGTLQRTAELSYGSWAKWGLRANFYDVSNVRNFLSIRARKILLVDPTDEIIPDLASLRSHVSLRALCDEAFAGRELSRAACEGLGPPSENAAAVPVGLLGGTAITSSKANGTKMAAEPSPWGALSTTPAEQQETPADDLTTTTGSVTATPSLSTSSRTSSFDATEPFRLQVGGSTGSASTLNASPATDAAKQLKDLCTQLQRWSTSEEFFPGETLPLSENHLEEAEWEKVFAKVIGSYQWLQRLLELIYTGDEEYTAPAATTTAAQYSTNSAASSGSRGGRRLYQPMQAWQVEQQLFNELVREEHGVNSVKWLDDNKKFVRHLFAESPLIAQVRAAFEALCSEWNAGGSSLDEVLSLSEYGNHVDYVFGLRQYLANLVCWGSLPVSRGGFLSDLAGTTLAPHLLAVERYVYNKRALRPAGYGTSSSGTRGGGALFNLTTEERPSPDAVAEYHRILAFVLVHRARAQFRKKMQQVSLLSTDDLLQSCPASSNGSGVLDSHHTSGTGSGHLQGSTPQPGLQPGLIGHAQHSHLHEPGVVSAYTQTDDLKYFIKSKLQSVELVFSLASRFLQQYSNCASSAVPELFAELSLSSDASHHAAASEADSFSSSARERTGLAPSDSAVGRSPGGRQHRASAASSGFFDSARSLLFDSQTTQRADNQSTSSQENAIELRDFTSTGGGKQAVPPEQEADGGRDKLKASSLGQLDQLEKARRTKVRLQKLGYVVHIDCGHNGNLSAHDFKHLAMYFENLDTAPS
ncbi:unnamed protein product [Amoebophrya sp. A120]|nr:unnamed protein product [Amoebophrya sp. A120]|eukprot:GSA120T00021719001.1